MDAREFGKTGLKLPPLVFGATSLGNLFRASSDEEKAAIVRAWTTSQLSPVVIDSAGKYGAGMSLEVIGRELDALDVDPSSVVISNKLGWRRKPLHGDKPSFEPDAWFDLEYDAEQDISRDGIIRCWEEGEELLGRYTAQLVSVHDPDDFLAAAKDEGERKERYRQIVEAYGALAELKASGAVAAVGIGAKNWKTVELLLEDCDFDWVMLANSWTILKHPPELDAFLHDLLGRSIPVINSALFHGGFLLGGELFDYRLVDPSKAEDQEMLGFRQALNELCDEFETSVFRLGIEFGMAHPAVHSVALSSSRGGRVSGHVDVVEQVASSPLPEALWQALQDRSLLMWRP
ncbi:MAG: aldo/keto reductase [Pirellulaceae bacterium]